MARFPIFAAVMAGNLTAIEALLISDPLTMPEQETNALIRAAKLEQGGNMEEDETMLSFLMKQTDSANNEFMTVGEDASDVSHDVDASDVFDASDVSMSLLEADGDKKDKIDAAK